MTQAVKVEREDGLLAGKAFMATFSTGVLTTGADFDVLIRTLAGEPVALRVQTLAGTAFTVEIFEAPTTSADGSGVTEVNRNRKGTPASSTLVAFTGPTVTGAGTSIGAQTVPAAASVEAGETEEYVLAADTDYLVRITNDDAGSQTLGVKVLWTEGL